MTIEWTLLNKKSVTLEIVTKSWIVTIGCVTIARTYCNDIIVFKNADYLESFCIHNLTMTSSVILTYMLWKIDNFLQLLR